MMISRLIAAALLGFLTILPAAAQAEGLAFPWQLGMQDAASPSAMRLHEFHDFLLWIISAITLFVLALLVWVVLRFNSKTNPKPSETTHNVLLEVVWTVVPVVILIIISLKSFPLLYYVDRAQNPEMTLKVTGRQWYWDYEYPDQDGIAFSSYLVKEEDLDATKGQQRLLSTDNVVVLPVDTTIQILVTAGDVLHAWAVPALGVKMDAVPGRMNETWVKITKPGIYYGQCSELCGKDHAYMPIEVHAVSKDDFAKWLVTAKEEFAGLEINPALHTNQFAALED